MKIAAIGDLHCRTSSAGELRQLLAGVADEAEILLLAGDLTDTGLPAEADVLLGELESLKLPMIAVLGNHDHESGQPEVLCERLQAAGVTVLDGSVCEVGGVGFVGTKGFCGGFDDLFIQPFGEQALKAFIQSSLDESVRLENALAKLDCDSKVAILHYAPIRATLEGEPLELYAFLGSSRLANALERRGVDLIVHGHAHHGSPFGQTRDGIPVHNVCRFVQARHTERAYAVFEV